MRRSLLFAGLAALLVGAPLRAEEPAAPEPVPSVMGEVAYSEVVSFDYDRDGTRDRVQFWLALEARPAQTGEGVAERPEAGSVRYFVYDVERKRKVTDWLLGFNMGFPQAGEPHPVTSVRVEGRVARFDLMGSTWTITDGGVGVEKDRVEIATGGAVRKARFHGGDFRVNSGLPPPPEPVDIPENRRCIECHRESAVTMAAEGGGHRDLDCDLCHKGHPPEVTKQEPQCLECHEPHARDMTAESCGACHSGHRVKRLRYGVEVPDAQCAVCHEESARTLRASRTRHMGLSCVVCHREEHGRKPTCVDCHGGPHPREAMAKSESCADCHETAHATKRGA